MKRLLFLAIAVALQAGPSAQGTPTPAPVDGVGRLLLGLERAISSGRLDQFKAIATSSIPQTAVDRFVAAAGSGGDTRAVVRERLRRPKGAGYDVIADVLVSQDVRGRIAEWLVSVVPAGAAADDFRIADLQQLAALDDLLKLRLDTSVQFDIKDLVLNAPDLTLTMASGSAFMAKAPGGITGLVLRGKGVLQFAPPDAAEQLQLRIFSFRSNFRTDVDTAFVRISPAEFEERLSSKSLTPIAPNPVEVTRAQQVFDDYSPRTYNLDLQSLTQERWSLQPSAGSVVVEFHTSRHGWLTYTKSPGDLEDVSLFDRVGRHVICSYSSRTKNGERAQDFDEGDLTPYNVRQYAVDASFDPSRLWISGRGSLRVRIRDAATSTLTIKLAQSLTVSSVTSPEFGELLALRVIGQNNLLVGLPATAPSGTEFTLEVSYAGRLPPQSEDREAIDLQTTSGFQQPQSEDQLIVTPEPRFMYSNRVQWYPQGLVSEYATARLRLSVPPEYQVIATGQMVGSSSQASAPGSGPMPLRTTEFIADRPVRYLSCLISKFQPIGHVAPLVPIVAPSLDSPLSPPTSVNLDVLSTSRMVARNRQTPARAAAMVEFYAKTMGEAPYPNLTLAILDDNLPGGHSPAYFVALHQALPTTPYSWASDPVAFENQYPLFFLAHELAHQWWGQAVGWRNYHDQWLSEGLAQYFAVLYAAEDRGPGLLQSLISTMRNSSQSALNEGPISLGYRVGHIRADPRAFRSILYNKAAVVLHMLRRFIGDEAFFGGLRRFYADNRFKKAGTDQLEAAFQAGTPVNLNRFFEQWVRGFTMPKVDVSWHAQPDGSSAIRVQQTGTIFDFPLTVTLQFADGKTEERTLKVIGPVFEEPVTSASPLRKVTIHDPLTYYSTR